MSVKDICGCDDFFALPLNLSGELDICGRDNLFFALHLNLSKELDICRNAAFGFKFFSNAALCVN